MRHFPGMGAGRPTKYTPEMPAKLIAFFTRDPRDGIVYNDKGGIVHGPIPPMFERFASTYEVCVDTLHQWRKEHPEFSEAYKRAKDLQRQFFGEALASGIYSGAAPIFVAKNETNMADAQVIDVTSKGERLGAGTKEVELLRDEYEGKFKRLLQSVNPPAK